MLVPIEFLFGWSRMASYNGFAPNFYYGQGDGGLAIYVSGGTIDNVTYNGQIVTIPRQSTNTVWVNSDGSIGVGSSVPQGSYAIATVVSGTVRTGGNQSTSYMTSFFTKIDYSQSQYLTADGILSITDIRAR